MFSHPNMKKLPIKGRHSANILVRAHTHTYTQILHNPLFSFTSPSLSPSLSFLFLFPMDALRIKVQQFPLWACKLGLLHFGGKCQGWPLFMNFWREGGRSLTEMFCSEQVSPPSFSETAAAAILQTVSGELLSAWPHVGPWDLSNE